MLSGRQKSLNALNNSQLAKEVDELLSGQDDKYKGSVTSIDTLSTPAHKAKAVKAPAFVAPVPSSSHLDAVPQATPINRNRVVHKKVLKYFG